MSQLRKGTTIRLSNGQAATIKDSLGDGGQGIVYLVNVDGQKKALKWYKVNPGAAFKKNLFGKFSFFLLYIIIDILLMLNVPLPRFQLIYFIYGCCNIIFSFIE